MTVPAISITRIADGRIVEEWYMGDELRLRQQLGAIPMNGTTA
ncbi:MAG: ester cyclase [Chloroflexota bacterium]|nr:ester cyclase [Chloroflexota bacterium]